VKSLERKKREVVSSEKRENDIVASLNERKATKTSVFTQREKIQKKKADSFATLVEERSLRLWRLVERGLSYLNEARGGKAPILSRRKKESRSFKIGNVEEGWPALPEGRVLGKRERGWLILSEKEKDSMEEEGAVSCATQPYNHQRGKKGIHRREKKNNNSLSAPLKLKGGLL